MPNASVPFATHPPTYQEVNKAIQKAKNRSSPCPLDQVSIIVFKKCPILRTYLTKLLAECWSSSDIPKIWGSGLTILLHKKGSADNPENFRPITLQPVAYKIFSSILRLRMTNFLMSNNLVYNTIQKGFWPRTNGVTEHTSVLSHIIDDARRHQRSVIVTLLDLRNAFGEVSHKLISKSLQLHSIPPTIINLVENIYNQYANVSICVKKMATNKIKIGKGVLQGDPCSQILFNICFNTLNPHDRLKINLNLWVFALGPFHLAQRHLLAPICRMMRH